MGSSLPLSTIVNCGFTLKFCQVKVFRPKIVKQFYNGERLELKLKIIIPSLKRTPKITTRLNFQ